MVASIIYVVEFNSETVQNDKNVDHVMTSFLNTAINTNTLRQLLCPRPALAQHLSLNLALHARVIRVRSAYLPLDFHPPRASRPFFSSKRRTISGFDTL